MLGALKRLLTRDAMARSWPIVERWAAAHAYTYRRPRGAEGFVVDGQFEDRAWRLEWGHSQRDYFNGQELRLRIDLQLPQQMQLLILSKTLMKALESETFERYTDNMKTQIDSSTPEEMRWLVMFPKLTLRALPSLHARITAVGSSLPAVARWLEGPLAKQLDEGGAALFGSHPFVLTCTRSRVMLRVELPDPKPESMDQAIALFEAAVNQLPSAVAGLGESANDWPPSAASSLQDAL